MAHEPISESDSDGGSVDPGFLYHDSDFDVSLGGSHGSSTTGSFEFVGFDPDEWNADGEYIGIQWFLPWWFPKSMADYAIYNTFYKESPLTFEGEEVPNLWEETHQRSLANDPNFNECDMEPIYQAAERVFPVEYHGRRELQFYKDWHYCGVVEPVENDDSVSEDDGFVAVDNHPKVLPGCK